MAGDPGGGSSTDGARQAWARLVGSCPVCQPTVGWMERSLPWAHSPPPSTPPQPQHHLWVGSQNAPGSWARFVSLDTKKNHNKEHSLGFEHEIPLVFPVTHVGTVTTVLALSKKARTKRLISFYHKASCCKRHEEGETAALPLCWSQSSAGHVQGSSWRACQPTWWAALTAPRAAALQLSPEGSLDLRYSSLSSSVMSKCNFQNDVNSPPSWFQDNVFPWERR